MRLPFRLILTIFVDTKKTKRPGSLKRTKKTFQKILWCRLSAIVIEIAKLATIYICKMAIKRYCIARAKDRAETKRHTHKKHTYKNASHTKKVSQSESKTIWKRKKQQRGPSSLVSLSSVVIVWHHHNHSIGHVSCTDFHHFASAVSTSLSTYIHPFIHSVGCRFICLFFSSSFSFINFSQKMFFFFLLRSLKRCHLILLYVFSFATRLGISMINFFWFDARFRWYSNKMRFFQCFFCWQNENHARDMALNIVVLLIIMFLCSIYELAQPLFVSSIWNGPSLAQLLNILLHLLEAFSRISEHDDDDDTVQFDVVLHFLMSTCVKMSNLPHAHAQHSCCYSNFMFAILFFVCVCIFILPSFFLGIPNWFQFVES